MTYVLSNPSPPLFLSIVCCASAWLLIAGFVWSLWLALCDGTRHLKKLHQIPCDRCQYFTGEYLLKCTVHPCKAFLEDAIDCHDFESRASSVPAIPCRVCSVPGRLTHIKM
jgi:hypothetical protein